MAAGTEIQTLLAQAEAGCESALHRLVPLVYEDLHRLAHRYLRREPDGPLLQTTVLVNEAYLRLVDQRSTSWRSRAHFLGIAATAMRRVLVNQARDDKRLKRGRLHRQIPLDETLLDGTGPDLDLLALDEALERLTRFDPRKARLVELRFFAGLTLDEAAAVLEVSRATARRDWTFTKTWLYREITRGTADET